MGIPFTKCSLRLILLAAATAAPLARSMALPPKPVMRSRSFSLTSFSLYSFLSLKLFHKSFLHLHQIPSPLFPPIIFFARFRSISLSKFSIYFFCLQQIINRIYLCPTIRLYIYVVKLKAVGKNHLNQRRLIPLIVISSIYHVV